MRAVNSSLMAAFQFSSQIALKSILNLILIELKNWTIVNLILILDPNLILKSIVNLRSLKNLRGSYTHLRKEPLLPLIVLLGCKNKWFRSTSRVCLQYMMLVSTILFLLLTVYNIMLWCDIFFNKSCLYFWQNNKFVY
jgi:uncharacterized SAM-binding protein YcdF (DUF218 family)